MFVPALTGLGAPYWNPNARGTISGITRGTTKAHIARATLEAIAFQNYDLVKIMEKDTRKPLSSLKVDGGAATNRLLMQFQADILNMKLLRPHSLETTALGAGLLAGLALGYWTNLTEIKEQWKASETFTPSMNEETIHQHLTRWNKAIQKIV